MVTTIAHAHADPFARNPTASSCLIWSSHIPSIPQLVSILILPSVAIMSTLFCAFTFVDMAFPYPSDTQSDMCAKKNVKRKLPRGTKNPCEHCTSTAHPSLPTLSVCLFLLNVLRPFAEAFDGLLAAHLLLPQSLQAWVLLVVIVKLHGCNRCT